MYIYMYIYMYVLVCPHLTLKLIETACDSINF